MKTCDLHTHSVFSDGADTPSKIIELAVKAGLGAVALCDHNTADGLKEFFEAAKDKNIQAIAGGEFSVDYNGTELHLLGLFIMQDKFAIVSELMKDVADKKRDSNIDLINSLYKAGYDISFDEASKATPNGKFNRLHIANILIQKGYVASKAEAFETLLSKTGGYYKEPERLTVWQMIDFLKSIDAVPVLAHPFLSLDELQLEKFLPAAKERGLAGMECVYSEYSNDNTKKSLALADRFDLKYSGGSDYHGKNKPYIQLGTGCGNLCIPYDLAYNLNPDYFAD